jgi:hypothetical protein
MADRFLLVDARTRLVTAETDVVDGMQFTETLNAPGSWSATLPLRQPDGSAITAATLFNPKAIFAYERGEILRWAGPVITCRVDRAAGTVNLAGQGYLAYLRRRILWHTKTYTATDQLLIVKALIDYAQATFGTPGDLGITTTALSAITTKNRDRTYFYYERKKIGELIEQLAAVRDGFDFRLTPRWSNGPNSQMVVDFGVTYPALGRQTGYVFDLNAAEMPTIDVDMSRIAYQVVATGLGSGEDIPSVAVSRASLISTNILLEDSVSAGDISVAETLTDHAKRRLDLGSTPLIYPNVVLPASELGTFIPGDQVKCTGSDGILDITGTYRIVEQSVNLPAEGPETLTLTLAPLAAWSE